jgi:hypothetical protein
LKETTASKGIGIRDFSEKAFHFRGQKKWWI